MESKTIESFSDRVLRDMSSAVLVLDHKGYITYFNQPAARLFELDPNLTSGTERFTLAETRNENGDFYKFVYDAFRMKAYAHAGRASYRAPSGKEYILRVSTSFVDNPGMDNDYIVITVNDITQEEALKQKVHDSSTTFSTFLYGFCVWMILYALWEFLKRPIAADFMTHGIEVLALVMLIFILCRTSLTWRDLGVFSDHTGKTVRTALIVAACAVAFLFAAKGVARLIDPNCFEPDAPFFDIRRFGLRQILYILTAGIQEFLARSVMQSNLKRIMVGKHAATMSIILSSLIFAALHIHLGFLFMIGAAILAGLEGILYEKQQSIIGVWIVHWAFGVCGTLLCLIDH